MNKKTYTLMIFNCIIFTPIYLLILVLWTIINLPVYFVIRDVQIRLYVMNNFVSIDQSGNTLYGGDPDETISSRLGKATDRAGKFFRRIVDSLFGKGHCDASEEPDEGKNELL